MKYDFICNETARLVTGNILDGNVCGGRSCKMYETCKARIEFDALPKHTPTDAEIDAAVANERKYGVRTDVADALNDPKNDVLVKTVYIPARDEHEGIFGTNVKLRWVCPKCGAPRGTIKVGRSYDGSLVLFCDTWQNPCGHVDKYADLRAEAAANGLNAPTTTECCICKKPIEGHGNNAHPLINGTCCDACNAAYVIPYRLRLQQVGRIRNTADMLPQNGKHAAEHFKPYIGKRVKITMYDGEECVGVLHVDTNATKYQSYTDADNTVVVGYYIDTGKNEYHFRKTHVKNIAIADSAQGGNV